MRVAIVSQGRQPLGQEGAGAGATHPRSSRRRRRGLRVQARNRADVEALQGVEDVAFAAAGRQKRYTYGLLRHDIDHPPWWVLQCMARDALQDRHHYQAIIAAQNIFGM